MSSSSLSLTKAKEIAIKFIKKYKDSLCNGNTGRLVSDDDIERYETMTPSAFFSDISVEANFGLHFSVFSIRELKHSKQAIIWMCVHNNYNDLVKKIDRQTDKSLCDYWQMNGTWYNLTEARMEALETIFDQLGTKPKTQTAKKSSKKPAKKVAKKDDIIEVSDVVTIKNDVAFINTEDEKFDHLMHLGGENVNVWVDSTDELDVSNQIDHVINAFKLAKKELDVFISELVKAKEAGAKNVVDTEWCPIKDFEFNK
jgi:hypothetical protein